jgi:hypothetical protein
MEKFRSWIRNKHHGSATLQHTMNNFNGVLYQPVVHDIGYRAKTNLHTTYEHPNVIIMSNSGAGNFKLQYFTEKIGKIFFLFPALQHQIHPQYFILPQGYGGVGGGGGGRTSESHHMTGGGGAAPVVPGCR